MDNRHIRCTRAQSVVVENHTGRICGAAEDLAQKGHARRAEFTRQRMRVARLDRQRSAAALTPCRYLRASLASIVAVACAAGVVAVVAPRAAAAPAPEVEYLYDVTVRRHYTIPDNDAVGYGHGICDKVGGGQSYSQIMGEVKADVTPNDEYAANYLVSNAVNLLCPELIWQLRNSAANYRPPPQ